MFEETLRETNEDFQHFLERIPGRIPRGCPRGNSEENLEASSNRFPKKKTLSGCPYETSGVILEKKISAK